MDNAQKAIMIGVGLFITIIIIAAVMLITGMGQDLLSGGQEQVSNISTSLQAQLTSDFDGAKMTGSKVIAAIKRYYKDESMILVVNNGNGAENNYGKIKASGTGAITSTTPNTDPKSIGELTNTGNAATYVPSTASYTSELLKIQGTDNVVGIKFTKVTTP